jgi:1-aminocyclopropane-1-carboxylate deaminase
VTPDDPRLPSPLEEITDDRCADRGVRLLLKRDDLIHPDLPGTKWRKLRHNLEAATAQGARTLLTFGGAYSNHLRATAVAGHHRGFATVGVVRGEERRPLNPSLARAVAHGMTLVYVPRTLYRSRADPEFIARLRDRFGDFHLLPEGGANALGVRGCAELPAEIDVAFDVLCCSTGTGATLAGVATALAAGQRAIGFSALKGGAFLVDEVRRLQVAYGRVTDNWSIETGFHFGGYARCTPELDAFVADFDRRHGVTLDRIYEAKMMYGLLAGVDRGEFVPGSTIIALLA